MESTILTIQFLFQHPVALIAYGLVIISILSLWVKKSVWLWAPILGLSYLLTLLNGVTQWITIIPIVILLLAHVLLSFSIDGLPRIFIMVIAMMISIGLAWELIRGFSDLTIASNIKHDDVSVSYDLWLNYGIPFIGIFPLAFHHTLLSGKGWTSFSYKGLLIALITSIVTIALLVMCKWIVFSPKINLAMLLWFVLVCFIKIIPEEGFFRGFMQKELSNIPKKGMVIVSIALTAIVYAFSGMILIPSLSFFLLRVIISILLSLIYHWTKQVETPITCRILIEAMHFFLFSYPTIA
ncbi:MAG: CPBP family intramembrane metalloprotease [Chlamydiales bacterium]|nr:CPBP family intramembrane metalloprotease [Chlamydiales bacterium]